MNRRFNRTATCVFAVMALMAVALVANPVQAAGPAQDQLRVTATRAPVDPSGDRAGSLTDLLVTFRDIDPAVPGIGLKAGGTITITLPEEFVNNGVLPVAATGSSPGCAPPLVTTCSTAVIVQGWAQSPVLPFPAVSWDPSTNAVTVTALTDWLPAGQQAPGPKAVHLALFGFNNPTKAGAYDLDVVITPDPTVDHTLSDTGRVIITQRARPALSPVSLAAGSPPPPFPNPLFQSLDAGSSSLPLLMYISDGDAAAEVNADFVGGSARVRPIRDADGRRIGLIRVTPARGARDWSLDSTGPSVAGSAFLTGAPVGAITSILTTDPEAEGLYRIFYRIYGGDSFSQTINTTLSSTET